MASATILDKLLEARRLFKDAECDRINRIDTSPSVYHRMISQFGAITGNFAGIPLCSNPLFPYDQACGDCSGSGDGGEKSTYCQKCHGGGAHSIQGVVLRVAQMIVIQERKPKRFPVSWPADVAVPRRPLSAM